MPRSDDMCICGHPRGVHLEVIKPFGCTHKDCECLLFVLVEKKVQKGISNLCKCGHSIDEHYDDSSAGCRHKGCSCEEFEFAVLIEPKKLLPPVSNV